MTDSCALLVIGWELNTAAPPLITTAQILVAFISRLIGPCFSTVGGSGDAAVNL